jgi:tellurium resistance protein TerZ
VLNLHKNQTEPLTGVTVLRVGVAWKTSGGGRKGLMGAFKRAVGTDLDLTCVALAGHDPKRLCWFDNEDAFDNGSLTSGGDNRTGKGGGDDETITARLNELPPQIDTLVFIVSAFKQGVSFSNVEGITLNLYDAGPGGGLIGSDMPTIGTGNACVVARARRGPDGWVIAAVNEMGTASTKNGLLQLGQRYAA